MYLMDIMAGAALGGAILAFICLAWLLVEFRGMKELFKQRAGINNEAMKLKMQAYERLTVYTERAALKNLVSRVSTESAGVGAGGMHHSLIETLKTEYEYNLSQQVYVSAELWNAITKLKDQNIYIINQLAANLPPTASGVDLSKVILEYSMIQNAELSSVVLDALQFEAKKVLDQAG